MKSNHKIAGILLFAAISVAAPIALWAQSQSLEDLFKDMPASAGNGTEKASAGAAKSAQGETATALSSPWNLGGEQSVIYHLPIFRSSLSYDGIYLFPRVENLFKLSGNFGNFKVTSNWLVDIWPLGTATAGAIPLVGSSALTVTPEDNYASLSIGNFNLDAGYFVQPWGTADGLNPTNNINPVDYTQSLTPESIPSLLFRLVYYPIPSVGLEAVFEPYKQDDLFPVSVTNEIPSDLFAASQISVSSLPNDLSAAVYGGRASFYTSLADFSISYLYDYDPYYTPEVHYVSYTDKSLTLTRLRIHRIGADAKTTVGPFGIWLESCLSLTTDPSMTSDSIRNPSLSWTVGSDVNYGPNDSFYLNFQYNGRYVFGYYDSFYTDYPGGQFDLTKMMTDPAYAIQYYSRALSQTLGDENEALLNTFVLKADFPFSVVRGGAAGTWKPGIICTYLLPVDYGAGQGTRYGSLLLQPTISFRPVDAVTLTLGGKLIFAWTKPQGSNSIELDTTDRLGMWHDQSNVYLNVSYTW